METELALLNEKVDRLTALVEAQNKRQLAFEELQRDLLPILNHMVKLSISQLAEIGNEFQLEDLLYLLKRLLRDTNLLIDGLDKIEAIMGLSQEVGVLGKQVFHQSVETLDQLEREGYFGFARSGWAIVDRIVKEFSEDDVQALGNNIVTILSTLRNMTQPEVLAMANNAISAIKIESPDMDKVSTFGLLREFSDPKVRKGMARLLNLVKALADQPAL